MPKKRIYKQKQKQSQKVIVNINTKGSSKKRTYNKKPIITQPQITPNNYNIPSLIIERPTQYNNQLAQQIQQQNIPIQNQLLENIKSGEPKIKSLIENIEEVPKIINEPLKEAEPIILEKREKVNIPIQTDTRPKLNFQDELFNRVKNPNLKSIEQDEKKDVIIQIPNVERPKRTFEDELFNRVKNPNLKSINQADVFQTNELIKKINQPQNISSFLEKALDLRRSKIEEKDENDDFEEKDEINISNPYITNALLPKVINKESMIKTYKTPTAEEIENQLISIDEAKAIATNPTEARRMINEKFNTDLEKEYEEYKNLGGKMELRDIKGKKILKQKINEIKEINTFLENEPKTKELKDFLQNKNINEKEYKYLSKEDLRQKVKNLII